MLPVVENFVGVGKPAVGPAPWTEPKAGELDALEFERIPLRVALQARLEDTEEPEVEQELSIVELSNRLAALLIFASSGLIKRNEAEARAFPNSIKCNHDSVEKSSLWFAPLVRPTKALFPYRVDSSTAHPIGHAFILQLPAVCPDR